MSDIIHLNKKDGKELTEHLFDFSAAILNFVDKSSPDLLGHATGRILDGFRNRSQFVNEYNRLVEKERAFRNKLQEISRKTSGKIHFSNAKGVANFFQDTIDRYSDKKSEAFKNYIDAKNLIDKSNNAVSAYARAAAIASHVANGVNAYQLADAWHGAVTEDNWNQLGETSSGILGGALGAKIGAGLASWLLGGAAATLGGAILVGTVAAGVAFGIAEGAKWLWDKLFGDDYANLPRDNSYYIVDPLTLDLDGDGIETVGLNGLDSILFDHNKDGISTGTGWVGKDDALLALDRNGDGLIDTGRELFGDNTLLKDGERAASGYQALSEHDDNGDGRIDAQDAVFDKLRAWRDSNQDGISQADELLTMEAAQVQALNLAHTSPNRNLGNGNTLARAGSYVRSDGTEAEMGDLHFASNNMFSRIDASGIALTPEQQALPNLKGMGRVMDLRVAA